MMQRSLGNFLAGLLIGTAILLAAMDSFGQIPKDAQRWHRDLTRNAQLEWGLAAPVSTFAAQIHQESGWRADAKSGVGAQGIAQFMPATATWLSGAYSAIGPADAKNPVWAIRALLVYDRHLYDRTYAVSECDHMAKVLSAYNGGPGWVQRDEYLASHNGLDPMKWWGHVETVNSGRSADNWQENRAYPKRILRVLEGVYFNAGWGIRSCSTA